MLTEPVFLKVLRKDGELVFIDSINTVIKDESGNIVAFEGIARDITKRILD